MWLVPERQHRVGDVLVVLADPPQSTVFRSAIPVLYVLYDLDSPGLVAGVQGIDCRVVFKHALESQTGSIDSRHRPPAGGKLPLGQLTGRRSSAPCSNSMNSEIVALCVSG
jgi:hypothetical protein